MTWFGLVAVGDLALCDEAIAVPRRRLLRAVCPRNDGMMPYCILVKLINFPVCKSSSQAWPLIV